MASQIAAIGAAVASAGRALPLAGNGLSAVGKGLEFAGALDQKLRSRLGKSSGLGQIAALLQSGTPMAAIVNDIAANLSGALIKAVGNAGNADAQTTLKRALASSLAPPGSSPPGSGTEQAAALEQQLTELMERLTGLTNTAGQQNEFPGADLDAETARETPAQQTKPTTAGTAQVTTAALSAFVDSLLSAAASAVAKSTSDAASATASTPQSAQSVQNVQTAPSGQTPALPDILTRMLTRAANANAQRGGDTLASSAPAASTRGLNATVAPVPTSATLFERLLAIVAEQQAGSQSDANGKDQQGSASGQQQGQSTNSQAQFAVQTVNAPAATQQSATPSSVSPYTTIDPQSVIDQIVKGISLRTTGDSSQVQLRLQPEHLGDVSLKITVTGNTITANVVAQNGAVRDVLLSNQQHLARSLAEAGLSLGKFSVNVSGGNAGFTQQQSQQQAKHGRSITAGGSLLSQQDEPWEDQRYGPTLVKSAGSLVFNYLA